MRAADPMREALELVAREYHTLAIGDERVVPLHPAVIWEDCPSPGCVKARAVLEPDTRRRGPADSTSRAEHMRCGYEDPFGGPCIGAPGHSYAHVDHRSIR
jgi:hypothetical protein